MRLGLVYFGWNLVINQVNFTLGNTGQKHSRNGIVHIVIFVDFFPVIRATEVIKKRNE